MGVKGLIRRARQHAGLSQHQLADRLSISYQSVSDAEGKDNPSPAVLARYGAAMGYALVIRYRYTGPDGAEIFIE